MSHRSGTLSTVGFDADDTLWQNEQFFRLTQERFAELLREHAEPGHIGQQLLEAEKRNLRLYVEAHHRGLVVEQERGERLRQLGFSDARPTPGT